MRRLLVLIAVTLTAVPSSATAGGVTSAKRLIRQCANHERHQAGLPPLIRFPALDIAASAFARDMAARGFFDHTDPDGNGPQERVDAVESGWAVGENIAIGYRSVRAACRGWLASPGHRKNILDPAYEVMGTGYARGRGGPIFVQVFAYPRDLVPPDTGFETPTDRRRSPATPVGRTSPGRCGSEMRNLAGLDAALDRCVRGCISPSCDVGSG